MTVNRQMGSMGARKLFSWFFFFNFSVLFLSSLEQRSKKVRNNLFFVVVLNVGQHVIS